jgi:peptidoglycan/xylan/chitin deacetylase (PgdA/CDA1 family)
VVRDRLPEAVALLVRWSGLAWLVRNTVARRRVSILFYHDPAPSVLERHLAFLARRYRFVSLAELVDALRSGTWSELPARALVLTIDDGHRGNVRLVELLDRYDVRPTLYVCTQIVGTTRHFWFLDAPDPGPLKLLSQNDRLARLRDIGFDPAREHPESPQALSGAELEAMRETVDLQSHGRFHPILTTCGEQECRREIERSRAEVAAWSGTPADHFSYPNGDYTEREIAFVREAGYRSARTTDVGWVGRRTDPYRLPVLGPWRENVSVSRLAADLCGVTGYLAYARRGQLRGRKRPIVA